MSYKNFFFAGGGTGGHIYPGLAIAKKLIKFKSDAKIHFFCSERNIDSAILSKTNFSFTKLPARGFSLQPIDFVRFLNSFLKSYRIAKEKIAQSDNPVVIGIGGFVAVPVCLAAHKLSVPVKLVSVDMLPGKANNLLARFADDIFVQFEETASQFAKRKIKAEVIGCPLRSGFENPQPEKAKIVLGLDKQKKILLITGASSGSQRINETICSLLGVLDNFTDKWQIVHLTGTANYEQVKEKYADAKIQNRIVDYYDDMPNLLAAADLVIGRSGAVSVAEYAASSVPSICMPYPYHSDMHQYLNAGYLVNAGAAIIVDDVADDIDRKEWLWEELEVLLKDDNKLKEMKKNCLLIAKKDAADIIAKRLLNH